MFAKLRCELGNCTLGPRSWIAAARVGEVQAIDAPADGVAGVSADVSGVRGLGGWGKPPSRSIV